MSEKEREVTCRQCGGTGYVILDRTWFKADGRYRGKCGLCGGTGYYRGWVDPDFARIQAQKRQEWINQPPQSRERG
jgi:hypothetical protein